MTTLTGRCLCDAVRFSIPAPSRFEVCHCSDCRRWHGASPVGIDGTTVTLIGAAETLTWFRSSARAERGFCSRCGSSLFYRLTSNPSIWSAYLGALESVPDRIPLGGQYVESQKPGCYRIVGSG